MRFTPLALAFLAFPLGLGVLAALPSAAGEKAEAKAKSADETKAERKKASAAEPLRLAGVTWLRDLDDARARASGSRKKPMRPVVWLRVLGDLEGLT